MNFDRRGERLWQEWIGCGHDAVTPTGIIYYTEEHVDLNHEVVARALASAVQRDGVVDSLAQGFRAIQGETVEFGYAGEVDGEIDVYACDPSGETFNGEYVIGMLPVTWVEVLPND
jgi:hypothetical protein